MDRDCRRGPRHETRDTVKALGSDITDGRVLADLVSFAEQLAPIRERPRALARAEFSPAPDTVVTVLVDDRDAGLPYLCSVEVKRMSAEIAAEDRNEYLVLKDGTVWRDHIRGLTVDGDVIEARVETGRTATAEEISYLVTLLASACRPPPAQHYAA